MIDGKLRDTGSLTSRKANSDAKTRCRKPEPQRICAKRFVECLGLAGKNDREMVR
jgi:hypothetical protein